MYGNPKASVIKIKKVQSKVQIPNLIELLLNDEDEVDQITKTLKIYLKVYLHLFFLDI